MKKSEIQLSRHRNRARHIHPLVFTSLDGISSRLILDCADLIVPHISILSKHRSGFRALHSTVTASLQATYSWAYNIDKGNVIAVVFLDLKKAFDTVDHHILLSKLHLYGITGVSHKWFSSYLDNRTQKFVVNGSLSECCTLKYGIPQGTILEPLLFLL